MLAHIIARIDMCIIEAFRYCAHLGALRIRRKLKAHHSDARHRHFNQYDILTGAIIHI